MSEFHQMGLDGRLQQAVDKLGWREPTWIQENAIPLILAWNDLLVTARTGSGKMGALYLPVLQRILDVKARGLVPAIRALVLAPSKELCHQILNNFQQLAAFCRRDIKVIDISNEYDTDSLKSVLNEKPDVVVSTPKRIWTHLTEETMILKKPLEILIIDEADLVFSFGYEYHLKKLMGFLPKIKQTVICSSTLSEGVLELKTLVLYKPVVLKQLQEALIPPSCQLSHYVIDIALMETDRFVLTHALLKLNLVRGKSLIFVNTVYRSYELKQYLEQFGIKACVLNSELPERGRRYSMKQFNIGIYDIIIASDDRYLNEKAPEAAKAESNEEPGPSTSKRRSDKESGVSRGIDFQFVSNVINFDFPVDSASYHHRVGLFSRANNQISVFSFASRKESPLLEQVETSLQELSDGSLTMKPFDFTRDQYSHFYSEQQVKDVWKFVTPYTVRSARSGDNLIAFTVESILKNLWIQVLRHDKALRTVKQQPHLRHIPDYIVPKTLKQLSRGRWVKNVATTSSGYILFPQTSMKRRGKMGGQKVRSSYEPTIKWTEYEREEDV